VSAENVGLFASDFAPVLLTRQLRKLRYRSRGNWQAERISAISAAVTFRLEYDR
jgi:hypothetical protein